MYEFTIIITQMERHSHICIISNSYSHEAYRGGFKVGNGQSKTLKFKKRFFIL